MVLRYLRPVLVLGVWAAVGSAGLAQEYTPAAGEEKVDLAQVPQAVRQTAEKQAAGLTFDTATKQEDGLFRMAGTDKEGHLVIVAVKENGDFVSLTTRTKLERKKLPRGVLGGLKAAARKNASLRGFRPKLAEQAEVVTPADGKKLLYEFEGTNGENERVRASIDASGKLETVQTLAKESKEGGEGKSVALADLPLPVQQGVQAMLPNVRFTKATHEKTTGGIESYLLTGQDPMGHTVQVDANPNGVVTTVRTDVPAMEVPAPATAALQRKVQQDSSLAGFKPSKYQRLQLAQLPGGGGQVFVFLGKNGKNQPYEVRVGPDPGMVTAAPASERDLADSGSDGRRGRDRDRDRARER